MTVGVACNKQTAPALDSRVTKWALGAFEIIHDTRKILGYELFFKLVSNRLKIRLYSSAQLVG